MLGTPAVYEPLVALANVVDRVCPVSGLSEIPRDDSGPAVAVNLHGRGPQSTRLLRSLVPGRLVAFAHPGLGNPGPLWRPDEHEVARWCRLVSETLGVTADPGDIALAPPGCPPVVREAVVVHPGAAYEARRWPAARFAEIAAWAAGCGLTVVVTGSAAERHLALRVAGRAGLGTDAVLAGRQTLTGLAALVSSARLVVCGDSGVSHLATAYRTPSVTLFGPTPPRLWGPPDDPRHVALWNGTGCGDPFGEAVDPALLTISTAQVIAAAADLLATMASPT